MSILDFLFFVFFGGCCIFGYLRDRKTLRYAVKSGNLTRVQELLDQGADINIKDDGKTALQYAVNKKNLEMIQYLVEHGANVNATDEFETAVLHYAIDKNNWEIVKYLVEHGADMNAKNRYGNTVWASVIQRNKLKKIQWLVKHFEEFYPKSNCKDAALFASVQSGKLKVVQWLVEQGADINAKDNDGNSVLLLAFLYGIEEIKYNNSLLIQSIINQTKILVQYLVEHGADVNAKNNDGATALHYAVANERWKLAPWLIEQGADINAKNNIGDTILHYAIKQGSDLLESALYDSSYVAQDRISDLRIMVQWLVEQGVDVNAKNIDKKTPLHYVALYGSGVIRYANWNDSQDVTNCIMDLVKYLVKHGAVINMKDHDIISFMKLCNEDMVQWLKTHSAVRT